MKKTIGFLAICATVTVLALPAIANTLPTDPVFQDQCTPEKKTALYNEFRTQLRADQAKAYELAKKYLECPAAEGEQQISDYLKNFIAKYDKASRPNQLFDLVYNKKDYAKAWTLGREILAEEPENIRVLLDTYYAGYAAKNEANNADTVMYAKKAISLIEGGKAPDNWTPYTGKDEALGYLYNTQATLTQKANPAEALKLWIKAAQFEGQIKKLPVTYALIAGAYETGPYAKMSADYKTCCEGKDETPESKLALENINQIVDRMIDAYARAVSLAGTDAKFAEPKKAWMESLTTWYKYRHNQSTDGMDGLIASVLSKPLPPEPTPLSSLPAAAPASTPTSGTGTSSGSSAGTTTSTPAPKTSSTAGPNRPKQ
jgi:hypothetical protein